MPNLIFFSHILPLDSWEIELLGSSAYLKRSTLLVNGMLINWIDDQTDDFVHRFFFYIFYSATEPPYFSQNTAV